MDLSGSKFSKAIVGNAFSLQMVIESGCQVRFDQLDMKRAAHELLAYQAMSCVGHADTAATLFTTLSDAGCWLWDLREAKRISVSLYPGDVLYVAQVVGGRLPEGCTSLPEGFELIWIRVTALNPDGSSPNIGYHVWGQCNDVGGSPASYGSTMDFEEACKWASEEIGGNFESLWVSRVVL